MKEQHWQGQDGRKWRAEPSPRVKSGAKVKIARDGVGGGAYVGIRVGLVGPVVGWCLVEQGVHWRTGVLVELVLRPKYEQRHVTRAENRQLHCLLHEAPLPLCEG